MIDCVVRGREPTGCCRLLTSISTTTTSAVVVLIWISAAAATPHDLGHVRGLLAWVTGLGTASTTAGLVVRLAHWPLLVHSRNRRLRVVRRPLDRRRISACAGLLVRRHHVPVCVRVLLLLRMLLRVGLLGILLLLLRVLLLILLLLLLLLHQLVLEFPRILHVRLGLVALHVGCCGGRRLRVSVRTPAVLLRDGRVSR